MAISPIEEYPDQVATDADYPQGKAQNVVVAGDGTGTPWEKKLVNDIFGFQQALLLAAGAVPSGQPDNANASQYLEAMRSIRDESAVKNWAFTASVPTGGAVVFWNPVLEEWYTFSSHIGRRETPDLSSFDTVVNTGVGDDITPVCSAVSPTGVMVFGGEPGSASNKKLRRSADGSTWTLPTTVANGTETVTGLVFHPAGRFVLALDSATNDNIEVSTDANGTAYAQLTSLPNSEARGAFISDGTSVVILLASSSSNKILRSADDASTWTEVTLPHTEVWVGGYYDPGASRFVIFGLTHWAYSDDGAATWTSGGAWDVPGSSTYSFTNSGRIFAMISDDSGVFAGKVVGTTLTIRKVADFGDKGNIAYGDGRFMATKSNGDHYWTVSTTEL